MTTQSSFFENLGKQVCQQLSTHAGRERIGNTLRQTLNQHLRGPLAQDAMPKSFRKSARDQDPEMPPRGAGEYNDQDAVIDPVQLVAQLKLLLSRLDPQSREILLAGLAEVLETDPDEVDGVPNNNEQVLDRSARDGAAGPTQQIQGRFSQDPKRFAEDKRRLAQDIAIRSHASNQFNKRWEDLTGKIKVMG